MTNLTAYSSYADAQKNFSSERLWELFDGNREHLNAAVKGLVRLELRAGQLAGPLLLQLHQQ